MAKHEIKGILVKHVNYIPKIYFKIKVIIEALTLFSMLPPNTKTQGNWQLKRTLSRAERHETFDV